MNDHVMEERKIIVFLFIMATVGIAASFCSRQGLFSAEAMFSSPSEKNVIASDAGPDKRVTCVPVHIVALNSANEEELCSLPGIGPVIAGRIIEYRKEKGDFRTKEELIKVKGIGRKKLDKISEFITVP